MRILIAGGKPTARSALRLLLTEEPGLDVVGEAGDRQGLLVMVAAAQPDLVLLDWDLANDETDALFTALLGRGGGVRIMVLSGRSEAKHAALAAGADAFSWMGEPPSRLLTLIRDLLPAASIDRPTPGDSEVRT